MAAKSLSFDELRAAFEQGRFAPLYFFYGEEGLLMDELQELLIQRALQPHERDFNLDVFSGPEADAGQVLATCGSFPMMAERRIVVVRAFESLADNRLFVTYAPQPNPTATVLLICQSKPNLTAHPYRALRDHAVSCEFKSLTDRHLPGWLSDRAKSMGLSLEGASAQMLAQEVGSDLRSALAELEKLRVYAGDRQVITEEDVLVAGGHSRDLNVFELQRAIGAGDRKRATAIIEHLLEKSSNRKGEALRILGVLGWYFQKLRLLAANQARRLPEGEMVRQIGVKPFQLREFTSSLRRLGSGPVARAPQALLAADFELKGGSSRDPRLVLLLVLRRILVSGGGVGTLVEQAGLRDRYPVA